jgi:hypothetical protein
MKAEENKIYALVQGDRCHLLFSKEQLPEWNENDIIAVDVTDMNVSIGDCYCDGVFSKPVKEEADLAFLSSSMRNKRDRLISVTDWTQLPDVPPTTAEKWLPYRQALRDIALQEGFPENITWPTPP